MATPSALAAGAPAAKRLFVSTAVEMPGDIVQLPLHQGTSGGRTVSYVVLESSDRVQKLVEQRILVEVTGQRHHRRFRYDPYVKLFDEGTRVLRKSFAGSAVFAEDGRLVAIAKATWVEVPRSAYSAA